MNNNPIFVAGAERSGTSLMYALLASHPQIAMTRRTNFWPYFYNQYGDLGRCNNFERCLAAMMRYKRLLLLKPDPDRIRREFWQGPPTYGRLFALLEEQHAERLGKPRWGDKSLDTERYADAILEEYPDAKILHMIRHPGDRYASAISRWKVIRGRVGSGTAYWLASARLARRHQQRYPDQYKIIRYETLVSRTEETLREICDFIGEPFAISMITMGGAPAFRDSGGNSSYGPRKPGEVTTGSLGRYRQVMSKPEIRFMQAVAKQHMTALGYPLDPVKLSFRNRLACFLEWPMNLSRLIGWQTLELAYDWIGRKPSPRRLVN